MGCRLEVPEAAYNWVILDSAEEAKKNYPMIFTKSESKHGATAYTNVNACKILGSDMGLQELLIAIKQQDADKGLADMTVIDILVQFDNTVWFESAFGNATFDLTKNLHNQSEDFYKSILPLING